MVYDIHGLITGVAMQAQEGNLVNFYSNVAAFRKDYVNRNPGLVLSINCEGKLKPSAQILWANGDISTEYFSYLQKVQQ